MACSCSVFGRFEVFLRVSQVISTVPFRNSFRHPRTRVQGERRVAIFRLGARFSIHVNRRSNDDTFRRSVCTSGEFPIEVNGTSHSNVPSKEEKNDEDSFQHVILFQLTRERGSLFVTRHVFRSKANGRLVRRFPSELPNSTGGGFTAGVCRHLIVGRVVVALLLRVLRCLLGEGVFRVRYSHCIFLHASGYTYARRRHPGRPRRTGYSAKGHQYKAPTASRTFCLLYVRRLFSVGISAGVEIAFRKTVTMWVLPRTRRGICHRSRTRHRAEIRILLLPLPGTETVSCSSYHPPIPG